jgi:hypothetical protein
VKLTIEIHEFQWESDEFQRKNAGKSKQNYCWKLLLGSCLMRNFMENPNPWSEFQKNAPKYALRVADP